MVVNLPRIAETWLYLMPEPAPESMVGTGHKAINKAVDLHWS
jgi:hypothetical protein